MLMLPCYLLLVAIFKGELVCGNEYIMEKYQLYYIKNFTIKMTKGMMEKGM